MIIPSETDASLPSFFGITCRRGLQMVELVMYKNVDIDSIEIFISKSWSVARQQLGSLSSSSSVILLVHSPIHRGVANMVTKSLCCKRR
jgi:hypothetical protein